MTDLTFSKSEIAIMIWCMEQMSIDFPTGEDISFDSAISKLETVLDELTSLADFATLSF